MRIARQIEYAARRTHDMPTVVVEDIPRSGRVTVTFAYDPVVVDTIKALVPVGGRRWNGAQWIVNRAYVDKLTTRLGQLGYKVVRPPLPRDNWAVAMFRGVEPEQRLPAYAALHEILTGAMLHDLERAYAKTVTNL